MRNKISRLEIPETTLQIPEEVLRRVLKSALSRGADWAEIFLEYKLTQFVLMEEDIIKETAENVGMGLGIRAVKGDQTGYGYTNDLRSPSMLKAARTAASIATGPPAADVGIFRPDRSPLKIDRAVRPLQAASLKEKIGLVEEAYAAAQSFSREILKVKVTYADQMQFVRIFNSEGHSRSDLRPMVKLTCTALAERDGRREAGYYGGGGRVGLDYFQNTLTPRKIGEEAAEEAILLLSAVPPPAGEMPVVLAPGHSGVLIHEAVGHLLEADFIRRRTSVFWDKRGRRVGGDQVTICDDPTIPGFRGSYNLDDEGVFPQKTTLIHKGRITGLLQDRISARILGERPTGNGRRQDYGCIPLPRMSNTYIERGEYDPEEIIRSVSRGFYAQRFQGGQVEDSGKFTFSVSSGYLIENGRLTRPAHQATLIGMNLDILKKIDRVGCDLEFGLQTGTCGKEGQAVPVTDGCPTLRISGITVGGLNE